MPRDGGPTLPEVLRRAVSVPPLRSVVDAADLSAMRRLVRATQPVVAYRPAGGGARWRAAAARLG